MKKVLATLAVLTTLLAGCATAPAAPPSGPGTDAPAPGAAPEASAAPAQQLADTKLGVRRPVFPDEPLPTLTPEQQQRFGPCLGTTVEVASKGPCATLALEELHALGFHSGPTTGRVSSHAVNSVLRYQRSRGLPATGTVSQRTWYALASGRPERPADVPPECSLTGVVLCVDQATEQLTYRRDGEVIRTVAIRTGGFTSEAKTGTWRLHPTANGLFKVYDKKVNPTSENYGAGAMPYSLVFDPDMYVHYSPDFAKQGYRTSSHGCVNVGSKADAAWLFSNTPVGARVYIY